MDVAEHRIYRNVRRHLFLPHLLIEFNYGSKEIMADQV